MNQAFPNRPYHIIAYFPEWVASRPYYVKDMDQAGSAARLSVINYAFGIPRPDPATGEVICAVDNPYAAYAQPYTAEMSVDGKADDPTQPLRGHFNQLKKLKVKYPGLKVVVSLGGWTGSGWFSVASQTVEARRRFVADCLDRWITGNLAVVDGAGGPGAGAGVFDGIDIDWEYPVGGGLPDNHTDPADAENFVLLLQEFRHQYEDTGRPDLLLTTATPAPTRLAAQYNLSDAHPYLDLVNIMSYDYRTAGSPVAGHHTNLCASTLDPAAPEARNGADVAVRVYRDTFGVPASKLVVGAAFYGRAWKEVAPQNNGLFQPGKGFSEASSDYRHLLARLERSYTRSWDDSAKAPYLYSPSEGIFWTYDDPESVTLKARYVRAHGLGGIMFWEITGDDQHGTLVEAIDRELRSEAPAKDPCAG